MRGDGKGHEFFGGTERSSEVLQEVIHRKKHAFLGALPPSKLRTRTKHHFSLYIQALTTVPCTFYTTFFYVTWNKSWNNPHF
jgi:hypothetical protein